MRNRSRQYQGSVRTRRYGKWLVIGLLVTVIAGLGKRAGNGRRRPNRSAHAAKGIGKLNREETGDQHAPVSTP